MLSWREFCVSEDKIPLVYASIHLQFQPQQYAVPDFRSSDVGCGTVVVSELQHGSAHVPLHKRPDTSVDRTQIRVQDEVISACICYLREHSLDPLSYCVF